MDVLGEGSVVCCWVCVLVWFGFGFFSKTEVSSSLLFGSV